MSLKFLLITYQEQELIFFIDMLSSASLKLSMIMSANISPSFQQHKKQNRNKGKAAGKTRLRAGQYSINNPSPPDNIANILVRI